MPSPKQAFTLIELLIVVAIIAILAAIAVPNFLEAQTRSKVSRAKADMRSMVTAIEAYYVDYNRYPLVSDEQGEPIFPYPKQAAPEFVETRISVGITTPVAYITTRFQEPFAGNRSEEESLYHYSTLAYVQAAEGDEEGLEEWNEYTEELTLRQFSSKYFILSHGPDLDHDAPEHGHSNKDGEEEEGEPAMYDPTNGTISNGDIAYFGPGFGFGN